MIYYTFANDPLWDIVHIAQVQKKGFGIVEWPEYVSVPVLSTWNGTAVHNVKVL